ncbi:MAG: hypothetical protein R3C59_08500 [Planctomycetaceae bacterium]
MIIDYGDGGSTLIQPQIRLSRIIIRPVALKAVIRQNRPNVAVEIHVLSDRFGRSKVKASNQSREYQPSHDCREFVHTKRPIRNRGGQQWQDLYFEPTNPGLQAAFGIDGPQVPAEAPSKPDAARPPNHLFVTAGTSVTSDRSEFANDARTVPASVSERL